MSSKKQNKKGIGNAFLRFTDPLNTMGLGRQAAKKDSPFTPMSMSSPFGTLSTKGNKTTYTPNYFPGQKEMLNAAPANAAQIMTGYLPQATSQYTGQMSNYLGKLNSLTADNMVNPEIYAANYHLQADPLLYDYHNTMNDLNGELAAKNLAGGSYDATAKGQMYRSLLQGLSQASNNAVNSGLNATGSYLGWLGDGATASGNEMGSLGNLAAQYQTISSNLQNQLMGPMGQYTSYQTAINPLQEAGARYSLSQPTGFQQKAGTTGSLLQAISPFLTKVNPGLGTAAQFGGAALKGLGNVYGNPNALGYTG